MPAATAVLSSAKACKEPALASDRIRKLAHGLAAQELEPREGERHDDDEGEEAPRRSDRPPDQEEKDHDREDGVNEDGPVAKGRRKPESNRRRAPVGPISHAARIPSRPMTTPATADSRRSEVRIDQTSPTAGLTVSACERVDDHVAADPDHGQKNEAEHDEADRDRADRLRRRPWARYTAPAHSARPRMNGQKESAFRIFTSVCAASSWSERMITIGSTLLNRSRRALPCPDATGHVLDDLVDVEHDRVVRELDAVRLAFEQRYELFVDRAVGRSPELLHAWPLESTVRRLVGNRAKLRGDLAGQRLEPLGQSFFQAGLGIGRGIGLVDDVDRERVADVLALKQLGARVRPLVGVERDVRIHTLTVEMRMQRAEDDQHRREDAMRAFRCAGRRRAAPQSHGSRIEARRPVSLTRDGCSPG